jgi:aldehyde dehydrogenase (NAD+)
MTTYEAAPLDAAEIVSGLRATLRKGLTRPLKWRLDQLHALVKLVEENEDDIYSALDSDLRRPKHDSFVMEVQ